MLRMCVRPCTSRSGAADRRRCDRRTTEMRQMGKRTHGADEGGEQDVRDQEVMRANRELAAYFKGKRTEREARAALKIIKRFVKDREHLDPAERRPLPRTRAVVTEIRPVP